MHKLLVRAILEKATAYKWSIQGLGMLRLYLSGETRLHVWDRHFIAPNASPLHTHPWAFDSLVVAGVVNQHRYVPGGTPYYTATVKCGPGGGIVGNPERTGLTRGPQETYRAGDHYRQWPDEIHESFPETGTVTIVTRHFSADRDYARVFWESGDFGSAEPRVATHEEVMEITSRSLERYF